MSSNTVQQIAIGEYDYALPDARIAAHPLATRDRCLLLTAAAPSWQPFTHTFDSLPTLLPPHSMLVLNDTRVINARMRFRKGAQHDGAPIEVFCLEPYAPHDYALAFAATDAVVWTCLVGNSKRWKQGPLTLPLPGGITLTAERLAQQGEHSQVRLSWDDPAMSFAQVIELAGELPIPPYLNRATEEADNGDYQTVYSRYDGSVAAPTAGLHFTPALLDSLAAKVDIRRLTLHVGAGTFRPVKSERIGAHDMHAEVMSIPRSLILELATHPRHITAVGTTSVRSLESLYHLGCMAHTERKLPAELPQWYPYSADHPRLPLANAMHALLQHLGEAPSLLASTRLMIAPGYRFNVVDAMVTNFHQPRSTLLLLVSAFTDGHWRALYDYALADTRYRFLSYGDACYLLNPRP